MPLTCPTCEEPAVASLGAVAFCNNPPRIIHLHNVIRHTCPLCKRLIGIDTPNWPRLHQLMSYFPTIKSAQYDAVINTWFTDFSN